MVVVFPWCIALAVCVHLAYDLRMSAVRVLLDHVPAVVDAEREFYAFANGWCAMRFGTLSDVVLLGRNAARVFFFCVDHVKPGNRVEFTQAAIANALEVPASRVSEAVKALVAQGYLVRRRETGRTYLYVNPNVAYRGSAGSHRAVIARVGVPVVKAKVVDILGERV